MMKERVKIIETAIAWKAFPVLFIYHCFNCFQIKPNGLRLAAAAGYQVDVIGFAVMEDNIVSEKRQAGCEHNRCSAQSILS